MMTADNQFKQIAEEEAKEAPKEFVFTEGEEVQVKGCMFTVSLINPPRIVLKAVRRADLTRRNG